MKKGKGGSGAIPSKVPGTVQDGIIRKSPNTGKGGTVRKGGGGKKGY